MPTLDADHASAAAVARMGPDDVRRMLAASPHVAAAIAGCGPISAYFAVRDPAVALTPARLAGYVSHIASRRLTVQLLDRTSLQMLAVIIQLGGRLSAEELLAETLPLRDAHRDQLVQRLVDRLLITRTADGVELLPGVANTVRVPGRSMQAMLLDQSITSGDLAAILSSLGAAVPSGKQHRLDALREIVGDRERLLTLRRTLLPEEARDLFDLLVEAGPAGVSMRGLGVDGWQLDMYSRLPNRQMPRSIASVMILDAFGLVWIDPSADRIGLWTEVLRGIFERMFVDWFPETPPALEPIHGGDVALPSVLATLHGILTRIAVEPLVGLKTGGLGVKAIRELAKRVSRPEGEVDLLVNLCISAGLVVQQSELVGRGRTADWVTHFVAGAEEIAAHAALPPGAQWLRLVRGWIDGHDTTEDRFASSAVRFQLLHDLLALDDGQGVEPDDFPRWLTETHALAGGIDVDAMVSHLRTLGLVPTTGPVGLTAAARVLLREPTQLAALLPAAARTIVVQADHTVVAPPTLEPMLRSTLERLAVVESHGAATVYRLDPTKIGAHLADGHTAAEVETFLRSTSSVDLPPTVSRMLNDIERQRGGLAVRAAATIVTAEDVLALATAVKVKAARLTLLAPTVAVSDLAPVKVVAALRAKGLAPSAGTVAGAGAGATARANPGAAGLSVAGTQAARPDVADRTVAPAADERTPVDAPRPSTTASRAAERLLAPLPPGSWVDDLVARTVSNRGTERGTDRRRGGGAG